MDQTSDNFPLVSATLVRRPCHAQDGDSDPTKAHIAHAPGGGRGARARAATMPRAPMTALGLLVIGLLTGCSGSPSRSILGSYFPSWMICALIGLIAALVARVALKATGLLGELPAPLVVLLSIGCATTFALWLLWLA